jgi:hypothetical protein
MTDKTEARAIADRLRAIPPFNYRNLIMRPAEDVNAACDMLVAQAAEIARLRDCLEAAKAEIEDLLAVLALEHS